MNSKCITLDRQHYRHVILHQPAKFHWYRATHGGVMTSYQFSSFKGSLESGNSTHAGLWRLKGFCHTCSCMLSTQPTNGRRRRLGCGCAHVDELTETCQEFRKRHWWWDKVNISRGRVTKQISWSQVISFIRRLTTVNGSESYNLIFGQISRHHFFIYVAKITRRDMWSY